MVYPLSFLAGDFFIPHMQDKKMWEFDGVDNVVVKMRKLSYCRLTWKVLYL